MAKTQGTETYDVTVTCDESGSTYADGFTPCVGRFATLQDAAKAIGRGDRTRGTGCFAIVCPDGRRLQVEEGEIVEYVVHSDPLRPNDVVTRNVVGRII